VYPASATVVVEVPAMQSLKQLFSMTKMEMAQAGEYNL
jgi:hypothetical protein